MRNITTKLCDVMAEARFRKRVSSFVSREERVPRRRTRKPVGSATRTRDCDVWTRPIYRTVAIYLMGVRTECGILVYRTAPAEDFRSIKVTSISCLIRSSFKNRRDAPRDSLFIAWRLINGSVQMSALHIFLDYFKNALDIYAATRDWPSRSG